MIGRHEVDLHSATPFQKRKLHKISFRY